MVRFVEIPTEKLLTSLDTIEIKGSEIVAQLENSEKYDMVFSPSDKIIIRYNLKNFIQPLGRVGKVLYEQRDFSTLRDFLKVYWAYKGEPSLSLDIVKEADENHPNGLLLRDKIIGEKEEHISIKSLLDRIPIDAIKEKFNRVVVGGEGDRIELQFLSQMNRKEAKAGDFLDPGIFVKLNGKIEVAPGVNRLVCTNGLIAPMYLWESGEFNFLSDADMFNRALTLSSWLVNRVKHPIHSVREISAALGDDYRKSLLNHFWKVWSERIELKDLTWYDVINDLTSYANHSLSNERYKLLEIPTLITRFEENGHCPTCSANVNKETV